MKPRLLVVDDEMDTRELLVMALESQGYAAQSTQSATEALEVVANEDFAVVLTDIGMGEMNGLDLCERLIAARPGLPVIVVTGQGRLEVAIAAMRAGAFDFITKPVDAQLLGVRVARAVAYTKLHDEVKRLRAEAAARPAGGLIGESAAMRKVYEIIARVGESDASVLVHGETGTGKELVARAVHSSSRRANGPFVALNCAAVPQALLESELFGHAKGAFTDAKASRRGLFVQATGGTLFLDEIGELPTEMQPKLLRALQERKVRPVGSDEEVECDVRIVAATNRDLDFEVFEKRFREDLYYRIAVITIELPALRERGGDILLLAQRFLERFAQTDGKEALSISHAAAEALMAYGWPGNVRELENCVERAVALARLNTLTVEDLPEKVRARAHSKFVVTADDRSELVTMDEVERRYILRVLSVVGDNKSHAAQILGMDRRTLYRKLERYAEVPKGSGDEARAERPTLA